MRWDTWIGGICEIGQLDIGEFDIGHPGRGVLCDGTLGKGENCDIEKREQFNIVK